jgi:hypothetical protein
MDEQIKTQRELEIEDLVSGLGAKPEDTKPKKEKKEKAGGGKSLKRSTKALIAGLLVIIVLAPAAFLFTKYAPAGESSVDESSGEEEKIALFEGPTVSNITQVKVDNGETYTIDFDSITPATDDVAAVRNYKVSELKDLPQDEFAISGAVDFAAALSAKELVVENPTEEDFEKYGFTNPTATIVIKADIAKADETRVSKDFTVKYGVKVATGTEIYVTSDTKGGIYRASDDAFITYNKEYYVDDTLVPSYLEDGQTAVEAKSFTVSRAGQDDLTLEKYSGGEIKNFVNTPAYQLTAPFTYTALEERATGLFSKLPGFRADGAVKVFPSAADKTEFGFDNPEAQVSIVCSNDKTYKLLVGKRHIETTEYLDDTGSSVVYDAEYNYIMLEGVDCVYQILTDNLEFSELTIDEFLYGLIFLPVMDNLKTLDVNFPNENWHTSFEGESEGIKIKLNDKVVNSENFRTFFQLLVGVNCTGNGFGETETGECLLTVDGVFKDGETFKYEFYDFGGRNVLVKKNGTAIVLANKSYVEKVAQQIKNAYSDTPVDAVL